MYESHYSNVIDERIFIFLTSFLLFLPPQADIDSLNRLANCGNIMVCCNPTSAMSMMHILKIALTKGHRGMVNVFFFQVILLHHHHAHTPSQKELLHAVIFSDPIIF